MTPGVKLVEGGLEFLDQSKIPWPELLGVFVRGQGQDARLFVLVPRPAPASPWFEVSAESLGEGEGSLVEFAASLRERMRTSGYRSTQRTREEFSEAELIAAVFARARLPGSVTWPPAKPPSRWRLRASAAAAAVIAGYGALLIIGYPLMWIDPPVEVAVPLLALTTLLAVGSVFAWVMRRPPPPPKGRALVLTPDGCVAATTSGARAFVWSQLSSFRVGPMSRNAELTGVLIRDEEGVIAAELDSYYFGDDMDLVVAVANAYRARHR